MYLADVFPLSPPIPFTAPSQEGNHNIFVSFIMLSTIDLFKSKFCFFCLNGINCECSNLWKTLFYATICFCFVRGDDTALIINEMLSQNCTISWRTVLESLFGWLKSKVMLESMRDGIYQAVHCIWPHGTIVWGSTANGWTLNRGHFLKLAPRQEQADKVIVQQHEECEIELEWIKGTWSSNTSLTTLFEIVAISSIIEWYLFIA